MHVGEMIHKIRKEKNMTLLELAQKSHVALATLSRIENGKMTGTLESHMNVCNALEIPLTDIYKNLTVSKTAIDIKTKKTRADVFVHDRKTSSEMLASRVLNKKMMPVLMKISRGGITHKEETKSGIEKFIYVINGQVEVFIGEEKYILSKGDTIYFESSTPHYFKNSGSDDASLICITCPPTL